MNGANHTPTQALRLPQELLRGRLPDLEKLRGISMLGCERENRWQRQSAQWRGILRTWERFFLCPEGNEYAAWKKRTTCSHISIAATAREAIAHSVGRSGAGPVSVAHPLR